MSTQTISAALPGSVVYVSGTVNDKAYTWTRVDTAWEADVDRAANETYRVALTAIDTLGRSTSYAFTLYYGLLNLITDRTQADVDRMRALAKKGWARMTATEKEQWAGKLKGAYNATDLNRVGGAVTYLADILIKLPDEMLDYLASIGVAPDAFWAVPYDPEDYNITGAVGWQESAIPTAEQLSEYLAKVVLLRAAFEYDTDPLPESMEHLTYTGANAIEKALARLKEAADAWQADKEQWADNTAKAWYFSGDLYAGEV